MRKLKFQFFVFLVFLWAGTCFSQELKPGFFLMDGKHLEEVKAAIMGHQESYGPAFKRLIREADKALKVEPFTVVSKKELPPSGDKHDYLSLGIYWWPNPDTKDGLPYVNRDGQVNPEVDKIPDHKILGRMIQAVRTLSLAYYLTDKEEYADKASQLLRTWFLAEATHMNPNLNYAQVIKGKKAQDNPYGIIDARGLGQIPDDVLLLAGSKSWTSADESGLKKWFSAYLRWLLTSPGGMKEGEGKNNHGFWYDAQVVPIALFVGDKDSALKTVKEKSFQRIALQIEPDGSMPLELKRTKSLHYSLFNIEAQFNLAQASQAVGVDLWNYQTRDGRGIRKALDYLVPYLTGGKSWTYQEIAPKGSEKKSAFQLLHWAGQAYHDKAYLEAGDKLGEAEFKEDIEVLIH